jgi:replication-associated recombination protein RarA
MATTTKRQHPPTSRGYQVHEVISALQKSIRRSDHKGAVYWGMELNASGHGAWAWSRLWAILSEDLRPTPGIAGDLTALEAQWKADKRGGGGIYMAHAILLLTQAPKSRAVCWGCLNAYGDYHDRLEIPDEALDRHTRRGLSMGRRMDHFLEEASIVKDDEPGAYEAYEQEMFERFAKANDKDERKALTKNPMGKAEARRGQEADNGVTVREVPDPQLPLP